VSAKPIRRQYFETPGGQIHGYHLASQEPAKQPNLVCLHPAPASGTYYANLMPLVNEQRDVYALDYPGYGGSDAIDSPSIEHYADLLLAVVDQIGGPADLLGFHTGCLVATEMCLRAPQQVRQALLIDVPYFTGEKQAALKQQMSKPLPLSADLECLAKAWQFGVTNRLEHASLARAFDLFVEHLRAGTNDATAFVAAFSYDCAQRMAQLPGDVTVMATRSSLLEPSHAAADQIPNCNLIDIMDIKAAVFESGVNVMAKHINAALTTA